MEEDKFKDLLEDEELTALRLAALASKKKNEQHFNNSQSASALPIGSIITTPAPSCELMSNQIPFVQSDRSAHNSYSWRKQNQSSRRRGGSFPKNSQRSNLIVISPVALNDGKNSEEKAPALILPQHKWCNSGNEDSMSPKTLRRTGPTRFNRHGSDSESSDDSDYDLSDNDSGSNETILQDEPPEHFSHLSPGCDNISESIEKKRRLSFQSLDSEVKSDTFDKNEATSVYKSLKNSLFSDTKQDNYGEETFNNSEENNYKNCNAVHSYTTKPSDSSEDLLFKHSNTTVGNLEASDKTNGSLNQSADAAKMWQEIDNSLCTRYSKDSENTQNFRLSDGNYNDYVDRRQTLHTFSDMHNSKKSAWQHEGSRVDSSVYSVENQGISADSKTHNDNSAKSHYLSDNDLRLELKKRMQEEMKSKTDCSETNEMGENRTFSQYNNSWDRNRQRYSHEHNDADLNSSNFFHEKWESSFHQESKTKQNFNRESDSVTNFNQRGSCRSSSRERTTQESHSSRDKRFEYSFDGRRSRYDRSSSLDRNTNAHSSSRGRRSERSSSQDRKRHERSSSQGKVKNNTDGRSESSLSPNRNKSGIPYRHGKNNDAQNVTEERRDWYKCSPKEKREQSSSSSSESKRRRSASQDRNKFLFRNTRNKQEFNSDDKDRHYNQRHSKNRYENDISRGRNRRTLSRDRDRHSSSRERSRRGSSRSPDSRSERSSSREKNRYSSSLERSKDEKSSSESESRYRSNSRGSFSASKFTSDQYKTTHDISMNQKKITKENVSDQDLVQKCNNVQNKKYVQNSEKITEESRKINTKDQSKSLRDRSERSSSKEKIERYRKPYQKYSRRKNSYNKHYSRSRSSSSESSSSYSSSSSQSSRPKIRSVPSVIKPVLVKNGTESKGNISENCLIGKNINPAMPQSSIHSVCTKRNLESTESNKPSNIKLGRLDGDLKASEGKRVPVHMRLGAFPRKRVIQMPKDVEAAFVNSSSSSDGENVNIKCKRQNIRIVTDMCDEKNRIDLIHQKYSSDDKSTKRSSPDSYKEKFKRVKAHR